MFSCRRLRTCLKHPIGRATVVLFLLSLPGLVMFSFFFKNMNATRIVSAMSWDTDTEKNIREASALSVNVSALPDVRLNQPLTVSLTTLHDVAPTHITTKNATKQEMNNTNVKVTKKSSTNKKVVQNITLTSQNTTLTSQNVSAAPVVSKKYLFYLCDRKTYCYGLGDRQRGLVSVYLLAEVTNRTFGIIMSSPSNFSEFYKPNLVPWDIPSSQLQGKSSVELVAYGPKTDLRLHEIDFNAVYPQDIVYVRTNHKVQGALLNNPLYKDKFPAWAKVQPWQLFQVSWLRLMTPTQILRQELNKILVEIAQKIFDEYKVSEILNISNCCEIKHTNVSCANSTCEATDKKDICCNATSSSKRTMTLKACSNKTCTEKTNMINCTNIKCSETSTNNCNNKTCTNPILTTPIANTTNSVTHECVRILEDKSANTSDLSRMKPFAMKFCKESRPILAAWTSVESIRQKQGYDKVNLNLVCVHIRLGHSATLPFENNVRNKPGTVKVVWEFLKPYLAKGQHVYLATDSQEVRKQAKGIFGDRVHVSSVPIAHIAVIQKGQDERSAFSLTLVEQLLLATSCKTLVISYSGFSMKAAQIRHQLPGGQWELFIFKNGQVQPKGVKWLMK